MKELLTGEEHAVVYDLGQCWNRIFYCDLLHHTFCVGDAILLEIHR